MIPKYRYHIIFTITLLIFVASVFLVLKRNYNKRSFQQIDSFQQVLPEFKHCEKALILFDIDDVLISTADNMGHLPYPLSIKLRAIIRYPQLIFKRNWELYYSIMWQQTKWFILEPNIIEIIHALKKQNCTILGLTSMETGSFGVINNFPAWRSTILKILGLEFSQDFPNTIFNRLSKFRNNYPELYNGILCCNQQPKGSVLAAFLNHFQLYPHKVVFFDDSIDNLISVEDTCIQKNIAFKGFHYVRSKRLADTWNMQRSLLQLDYLVQKNQWLSDSKVEALLKNQP